jgi:hypothetical protein
LNLTGRINQLGVAEANIKQSRNAGHEEKNTKWDGTGSHRSTNTWLNMTILIENEKLLYPSNPQMTDVFFLFSLNPHPMNEVNR